MSCHQGVHLLVACCCELQQRRKPTRSTIGDCETKPPTVVIHMPMDAEGASNRNFNTGCHTHTLSMT
jgi:hypothetical protein